jgi:hypothetical protein
VEESCERSNEPSGSIRRWEEVFKFQDKRFQALPTVNIMNSYPLECDAVQSGRLISTFRRNLCYHLQSRTLNMEVAGSSEVLFGITFHKKAMLEAINT